ncbi:LuxR family transcriptional regulator [Spirochaeta lutea]|uniref:LuxR family transcriptional regulator n=1 Tax=Spirochaeta lutea TaxID=1480694 RepID=A0A098R581_9SPIO|nr:LuxR family transcriptional regulator [Spirochaeta lutea]
MHVLVVDDDPLVAQSLKTIICTDPEFRVVNLGTTGDQAIELYRVHRPDILLLDIRMPGKTGIQAAAAILQDHPEARILFLTTFSDDQYIIQALTMGAAGYLLKQNYQSIVPALRSVYQGQRVFGDAVADRIPSLVLRRTATPQPGTGNEDRGGLSEREFEIMKQVAQGLSNREISQKVYLGEGTVRNYVSTILEKLQLRDRTQLAVYYYKHYSG